MRRTRKFGAARNSPAAPTAVRHASLAAISVSPTARAASTTRTGHPASLRWTFVVSMAPVEPIAQIPAQNLAVGVLRKLGDKLYPLRLLEAPEMIPAER